MAKLKKLFEPLTVGSMKLKNRVSLLPLAQGRLDRKHYRDYILRIIEGGTALVVITSPAQHEQDDESFRYLAEMARAVHARGGKIAGHWGTGYGMHGQYENALFPSEGFNPLTKRPARVATLEDIHNIIQDGAAVTQRCVEAGFDTLELHIGMGYLLNRFLSTYSNRRTDGYGDSVENRMRIVLECLEAIRSKMPKGFPLMCRFTPIEFMPGGLVWDDWKPIAPIIDRAGIDIWSVQPGWHECSQPLTQPSVPAGTYLYLSEELKQIVKTPVLTAYRINDPRVAERFLVEGKADLIGLGRQLLADPDFCNKAEEGRFDEIRSCIACNYCLMGQHGGDEVLIDKNRTEPLCYVNPECGMEKETALKPVTKAKKVFVIGGGPAGMQAAMRAADRGHKVTLFEKGDRLGGQLIIGSVPPYKEDIKRLAQVLATQVKKAGVKVKLNTEVTRQLILDNKPDAIIVASGARPAVSDIPGSQGANVISVIEALANAAKVGKKVVVIGGGLVGCETAEFLAGKGKTVTILEMLSKLAVKAEAPNRWVMKDRLIKANIALEMEVRVEEITPQGVKGVREGKSLFFPADTVVLASGSAPNQQLFMELESILPEVRLIGDSLQPRNIKEAIREGFFVGNTV